MPGTSKTSGAARRVPWLHNRVDHDLAIALAVFAVAGWLAGPRGLAFLALESAVAIAVLEMFNYVAHYGLIRERDAGGGLEPSAPHHSWNSSNVLANPIIFHIGRRSDHHARLVALVPPPWHRIMDPKARSLRAR